MLIHIKGSSKTGKTTLIEELIRKLDEKGMKTGVIKHSMASIDTEGKDSYRYKDAGAPLVCLIGEGETALFISSSIDLARGTDLIRAVSNSELDPIIVESFSSQRIGDVELDLDTLELRVGGDSQVVEKGQELKAIIKALEELGEKGKRKKKVLLYVDGRKTPTNPFVTDVIFNIVRGVISPLHGCGHIGEADREVRIKIKVDSSKTNENY